MTEYTLEQIRERALERSRFDLASLKYEGDLRIAGVLHTNDIIRMNGIEPNDTSKLWEYFYILRCVTYSFLLTDKNIKLSSVKLEYMQRIIEKWLDNPYDNNNPFYEDEDSKLN